MPPVPGGLLDVAALSSSSALGIGVTTSHHHSRVLVARWNGAVWTTLSDPALPRLSDLFAVAVYPGGGWAVGEYGLTDHGDGGGIARQLMVRVTGTTVRRVAVPGTAYGSLNDVAATSAANAWAVGSIIDTPLILHWNGTAWTRAHLPATVGRGAFQSVAATSATNAWAVLTGQKLGRSRIVHWNGRRWGDVVSPAIGVSYRLLSVAATSATNVWAVGSTGSMRAVILHWNGLKWTCALSPKEHRDLPFRGLGAVTASSQDNAWAVGYSDGTANQSLALHWNGLTWKRVMIPPSGGSGVTMDDVAAIPQSDSAWAVGQWAGHGTVILHWNGTASH